MVKYVDRKNTNCNKWDSLEGTFGADGLLPLWVADMDFRIDEHIIQAMHDYIEMGIPGYYKVPDSYYQAFIDWEREEHGFEVSREWIRFSPGRCRWRNSCCWQADFSRKAGLRAGFSHAKKA